MEDRLWLASNEQKCPLVCQAYVAVLRLLRENCSGDFLKNLGTLLMKELLRKPHILELGSSSFHQSAVHFLCEDPDWAYQVWPHLSSGSAVTRLSLVKWVKEGRGWRGSRLQNELEKILQASLKEALMDQDVEYKSVYLSALVEVMTPDVLSVTHSQPVQLKLEGEELQECVQLLLEDLEGSRGGPELLSQTLCALSLLLSPSTDMLVLQRWCMLLETHRCAEAPEALRLACAQALVLTGASLVTSSLMGSTALEALSVRCSTLYEQDNANMFLEPSVISETILPYLLCLAKRYPESSVLARLLDRWEQENTVSVRENLSICAELHLGDTIDPDWLSVLMEPRFHGALCGLYAKAAFLLHIHSVSKKPRPLGDPSVLDLLEVHKRFSLHGVYLPDCFVNDIRTERV
ncbi:thyroid adenoma-associated protein-like isoform X1 [Silurus meridionalis]|nr:thyroid adenoma-associated protein-like isoform X1 [Silurus meridionalis]